MFFIKSNYPWFCLSNLYISFVNSFLFISIVYFENFINLSNLTNLNILKTLEPLSKSEFSIESKIRLIGKVEIKSRVNQLFN